MKLVIIIISIAMLFSVSVCSQDTTTDFQVIRSNSGLSLHKELFMLPVTFSDKYKYEQTEAVFQLSAKHRLFGTRFYFAYTQISFWQAYDHEQSAPFRETNYNPEFFYRPTPVELESGLAGFDLGFEHESNGQIPPVSRSWNLLYISPHYMRDNLLVYLKIRYRIPEDKKEDISHELLVETILNYGDMNSVKEIIHIMGFKNLSKLFSGIQGRKKLNY